MMFVYKEMSFLITPGQVLTRTSNWPDLIHGTSWVTLRIALSNAFRSDCPPVPCPKSSLITLVLISMMSSGWFARNSRTLIVSLSTLPLAWTEGASQFPQISH